MAFELDKVLKAIRGVSAAHIANNPNLLTDLANFPDQAAFCAAYANANPVFTPPLSAEVQLASGAPGYEEIPAASLIKIRQAALEKRMEMELSDPETFKLAAAASALNDKDLDAIKELGANVTKEKLHELGQAIRALTALGLPRADDPLSDVLGTATIAGIMARAELDLKDAQDAANYDVLNSDNTIRTEHDNRTRVRDNARDALNSTNEQLRLANERVATLTAALNNYLHASKQEQVNGANEAVRRLTTEQATNQTTLNDAERSLNEYQAIFDAERARLDLARQRHAVPADATLAATNAGKSLERLKQIHSIPDIAKKYEKGEALTGTDLDILVVRAKELALEQAVIAHQKRIEAGVAEPNAQPGAALSIDELLTRATNDAMLAEAAANAERARALRDLNAVNAVITDAATAARTAATKVKEYYTLHNRLEYQRKYTSTIPGVSVSTKTISAATDRAKAIADAKKYQDDLKATAEFLYVPETAGAAATGRKAHFIEKLKTIDQQLADRKRQLSGLTTLLQLPHIRTRTRHQNDITQVKGEITILEFKRREALRAVKFCDEQITETEVRLKTVEKTIETLTTMSGTDPKYATFSKLSKAEISSFEEKNLSFREEMANLEDSLDNNQVYYMRQYANAVMSDNSFFGFSRYYKPIEEVPILDQPDIDLHALTINDTGVEAKAVAKRLEGSKKMERGYAKAPTAESPSARGELMRVVIDTNPKDDSKLTVKAKNIGKYQGQDLEDFAIMTAKAYLEKKKKGPYCITNGTPEGANAVIAALLLIGNVKPSEIKCSVPGVSSPSSYLKSHYICTHLPKTTNTQNNWVYPVLYISETQRVQDIKKGVKTVRDNVTERESLLKDVSKLGHVDAGTLRAGDAEQEINQLQFKADAIQIEVLSPNIESITTDLGGGNTLPALVAAAALNSADATAAPAVGRNPIRILKQGEEYYIECNEPLIYAAGGGIERAEKVGRFKITAKEDLLLLNSIFAKEKKLNPALDFDKPSTHTIAANMEYAGLYKLLAKETGHRFPVVNDGAGVAKKVGVTLDTTKIEEYDDLSQDALRNGPR